MNYRMLAATALACGTIGGAALAQQEDARVLVDLVNVQGDIAAELGIHASAVPMNVMAPIGIAAEACAMDASELAQDDNATGGAAAGGSGNASADAGASADADASGDASGSDSGSGSSPADTATDSTAGDTDAGGTPAACTASTSSTALAQFVKQEMDGSTTP